MKELSKSLPRSYDVIISNASIIMFGKYKSRLLLKILKKLLPKGFYFYHDGFCPCCDENVFFLSYNNWLRDWFRCSNCGSIPRERAIMHIINKQFPNWIDISIHESSPIMRGASLKLLNNAKHYSYSYYLSDNELGSTINGYHNQNLENLNFPDESFDLFITQDVLEHIYNPARAFSEIARVLKPGGAHIFTVPIVNKHMKTQVRAKKNEDGSPNFLFSAEWHGNPIDKLGSPVTMHFGFDIVDQISNYCGMETIIENMNNLHFGIAGEYSEVLISKKK